MADANAYNALLGDYGDPSYWRTPMRQPNALYDGGPVWENNHAAPATPKQRPADWSVTSGIAEAISPTMGAYGMGAGVGQTYNALSRGDYAGAAEAGLPLMAMAMVPGPKGMGKLPAAAGQPKGIRAYHGSPHDFEKFDTSKIGTGEGAQAYGHGLYFAEQEAVAKSYRDTLSHKDGGIDGIAQSLVNMAGGDWAAAAAKFERQVNKQKAMADAAGLKYEIPDYDMRTLEALKKGQPGRMYEVNIKADPEHFLDWDKPLGNQPAPVVNKLQALPEYNPRSTADKLMIDIMMRDNMPSGAGPNHPQVTEALKAQGIPGIRYLDQGSRGAGEGSRNYVVFDPSTIEILRKYGVLGPMAGGVGVNALYGSENQ